MLQSRGDFAVIRTVIGLHFSHSAVCVREFQNRARHVPVFNSVSVEKMVLTCAIIHLNIWC